MVLWGVTFGGSKDVTEFSLLLLLLFMRGLGGGWQGGVKFLKEEEAVRILLRFFP